MSAPAEATRDFFIYRERDGTPAVVDTLSRVPKHGNESLRVITLPKRDEEEPFLDPALLERVLAAPQHAVGEVVTQLGKETSAETHARVSTSIDPTSVLLGAAIGFAVGVIAARLLRAPGWIIKIGLVLAATTLGGGLYYGWVRQQIGLGSGETLVHPGTIIEDARRAADAANQRNTELETSLDATE